MTAMFQVDAFSDRIFGGNPAAVLVLDDWLADAVMQSIAAENNLAETAFARPNGKGWDLRWFTPVHEVDFCGHATLATAHVLAAHLGVTGIMAFSTRVGELRVAPVEGGYQLDLPCFAPETLHELPATIAGPLEGVARAIFRNFENVFAELPDEAAVRAFVPDLPNIAKLGAQGLVITAKGQAHDFVSRYFAPGAGIPEDPVTGSIHATLVPHWADKLGKNRLSAFQASARGGHLLCELAGERVLITGKAVTFMEAEIHLS
ncbi:MULTISPECIES: PhzF family phenazine biosynthesis protein [Phyllobacteriaceae]|jgi:PhzF family phenazine biosynthesis protein|nr:PhzF family phenazine biosynthesis protein [Mesorhizobium sp. YL-MeA3-2017]MDQ0329417.1 PhzF family phenazine biosynthesis protein [Mesorhizobium sp. YL-MeA3-2017]